jgi:hypothetical protein
MSASSPSLVLATSEPPPFPEAWLDSVFVVPEPPAEWPRTFAIVTAHNPEARLATDRANDEYEKALAAYLRSERIGSFAVVGASADLTHHEAGRGFAVSDLELPSRVSRKFRQAGFFLVEDGVVYICVDASGKAWKVGAWNDRVVGSGLRTLP